MQKEMNVYKRSKITLPSCHKKSLLSKYQLSTDSKKQKKEKQMGLIVFVFNFIYLLPI